MNKVSIKIKLSYKNKNKKILKSFTINTGLTIQNFLKENVIKNELDNMSIKNIGVFGKIVPMSYILKNLDRIEIYEKIKVDAKQRRFNILKKNKNK